MNQAWDRLVMVREQVTMCRFETAFVCIEEIVRNGFSKEQFVICNSHCFSLIALP